MEDILGNILIQNQQFIDNPNKNLCIFVPAPLWYTVAPYFLHAVLQKIWCQFSTIIKNIDAGAVPSDGAIWDEFTELSQHRSIKKSSLFNLQIWCK